jgi:glycosyltransferase involved in cell wall biosynthesis
MNIGFFCNEYPPKPQGGIGTFVQRLATALVAAGHRAWVVGFGPRPATHNDNGVRVSTIESASGGSTWRDRLTLRSWLEREAAAEKADVIEIPEYGGMLPFPVRGVPIVVRHHQSSTAIALVQRRLPSPLVAYCERTTLTTHRHWIGVSRHILEHNRSLFRLPPARQATIYSPLPQVGTHDLALGSARRRDVGPYVVFVGKLSRSKGAFALARAARRLLRRHSDLRFVFVGPDVSSFGVRGSSRIQSLVGGEFAERVILTGSVPYRQALGWISGAEAFVLPSLLEALPMSALEAIASEVPVVLSRLGPGTEMIEHESSGMLVDPSDSLDLAAALDRILSDRQFARGLVERARAQAGIRHSLERCVSESLTFYDHCRRRSGPCGS